MKVGDRAGNRQSDSNLLTVQPEAPGQLEGVQPLSPPPPPDSLQNMKRRLPLLTFPTRALKVMSQDHGRDQGSLRAELTHRPISVASWWGDFQPQGLPLCTSVSP